MITDSRYSPTMGKIIYSREQPIYFSISTKDVGGRREQNVFEIFFYATHNRTRMKYKHELISLLYWFSPIPISVFFGKT